MQNLCTAEGEGADGGGKYPGRKEVIHMKGGFPVGRPSNCREARGSPGTDTIRGPMGPDRGLGFGKTAGG